MTRLLVAKIRTDGGTQVRSALDAATISRYAEAIRAGATMPPVVVFYDGKDHWLADGFHRVDARKLEQITEIDADVRTGTRRDALLHALGANEEHGLQRTNADKRRAVETMLRDEEWSGWSNEKIAKACRVSPHTVASVKEAGAVTLQTQSETRKYTTRHGTEAVMNTANIGKAKPAAAAPSSDVNVGACRQDDDADFDDEPEIVKAVGDAEPVIEREVIDRRWGSFEITSKVASIVSLARRFREDLAAAFEDVDPRFEAEVCSRAQDALLSVTDAVVERLPAKAGESRARLVLVPGGGKS